MMDRTAEIVLQLLRSALNPSLLMALPEGVDWNRLLALSTEQCVWYLSGGN